MSFEDLDRLEDLYLAACELPQRDRERFLDVNCNDNPELRNEVEELLQVGHKAKHLLSEAVSSKLTELDEVGPYRILEVVGQGGMGTVYLAEQKRPIRRKVAIKIIRAGMDSRGILARFESERQALAMMDHPNIAKILGSGTTTDRRPYFAMEYVQGLPLTDYSRKHRLPVRDRLNLFKQICLAVQHAHQKAILHRDLKPGNILVTDLHGPPTPRIIDFGLAKAIGGHRLTQQTFFTTQGVMIGTPEYMSPEQADPSVLDIDTRTDVYSLGVILYRLLAGVLPLEIRDLRADAQIGVLEAVRRKVCDEEPQKPSTRIGSSPDLGSEVAALRRMDRSSLVRRLKGDLDWITMKALEKDRNRRYATASDLAADIDRHLNHEPVSAGPPSRVYQLKKFVRKNLGVVVSLAGIIVALAIGGSTAMVALIEKSRALDFAEERRAEADREREEAIDAKEREREQRQAAVRARKRETKQRERAEKAEQEARAKRDEAEEARNLAEEKEREARESLAEYTRMADVRLLRDLLDEVDHLWPAHPREIPKMQTWIGKARELAKNLAIHEADLEELRWFALPYDQEMRRRDRELHPHYRKVLRLQDRVRRIESSETIAVDPFKSGMKSDLIRQIEELESEIRMDRSWFFVSAEDQWRHDTLTELVDGLEALVDQNPNVGDIADVEKRIKFAQTLREKTIESRQKEWDDAITSIRNEEKCPSYKGLEIAPQIGIVPIGRDPVSGLLEFAHIQTGVVPKRDEDGKLVLTDMTGLVFVLIPGGTFWMGGQKRGKNWPNYDPQAETREYPVHKVTLNPFFLSKYEMTQNQWRSVTRRRPSRYIKRGFAKKMEGLCPIKVVSWEDCDRVLSKLDLFLPTEAQWEYAARGGTSTIWWTGNDPGSLHGAANIADQAGKRSSPSKASDWSEFDDGFPYDAPIGTYRANPFGLHDVHGNVWEWCQEVKFPFTLEAWEESFTISNPSSPIIFQDNPGGTLPPQEIVGVYRGGSFARSASFARAAIRNLATREHRRDDLGVRPMRRITTE